MISNKYVLNKTQILQH